MEFKTYFISNKHVFTDVEVDDIGLTRGWIVNGAWMFPDDLKSKENNLPKHYIKLEELYVYRTHIHRFYWKELSKDIKNGRKKNLVLKFTELSKTDQEKALRDSQTSIDEDWKTEEEQNKRGSYLKPQEELRQLLEYKFETSKFLGRVSVQYSIPGTSCSNGAWGRLNATLEEIDARPHYYEYWDCDVQIVFMDEVYSDELNKVIKLQGLNK